MTEFITTYRDFFIKKVQGININVTSNLSEGIKWMLI